MKTSTSRWSASPTHGLKSTLATTTLRELAEHVKRGVRDAGGVPVEFNVVAANDAMGMGHIGMKASLVSRDLIADSIELMAVAYQFDALVLIGGCDKTQPGCVMAMARLNIPSIYLYGGSIPPGNWQGKSVTIQDVFEAVGAGGEGQNDFGAVEGT
jgi:dihydroxy-acid dehydratase